MSVPLFVQSDVCRSGSNCATCRDLLGGEAWRVRQMGDLDVPEGVSIFPCPDGKPWTNTGGGPGPTAKRIGSTASYPDPGPPQPVPAEQWPAWAKLLAKRRKPGEVGVGSTVERLTGKLGKRFEALMKKMGADCGCSARKARWDLLYPY